MIKIVKIKINNSDVLNRLNMRRAILIVRIQANNRGNDTGTGNCHRKRVGKRIAFPPRPDHLLKYQHLPRENSSLCRMYL
jgi:hypothetical protein